VGFKEKLIELQLNKPQLFLVATLVITLLTIPGYFNLLNCLQPSVEKLLPKQEEVVKNINLIRDQYDIDAIQLVIEANGDLRDPQALKTFDYFKHYLQQKVPYISYISTPADIVKEDLGRIPNVKEDVMKVVEKDPRFRYYYNHDYSVGVIYIYTDVGADTWKALEVINTIKKHMNNLERYFPFDTKVYLTGFPALNIDLFFSIIFDFIKISAVAFAVILLILIIKFRRAIDVLLVVSVIFFPLIWTTGIIGYLGLELTIVSTVFGAMLMALGISYGINFYNTYLQEKEKLKDKREALKETTSMLLTALVGSSLTTIASFIALLSGVVPSYRSLGIILAIGISLVLIYTLIIFPAFISLKEGIHKIESKS